MRKLIRVVLCLVLLGFIHQPASAQADKSFGLAMHGSPKHGTNDKHYDFVNPDAPQGGKIILPAIGTFDSLNPFAIKGTSAQGLHFIYERLMARSWDEPFTLYPLIAKNYKVAEDRSWIEFHLNPNARFSDGSSITADDVAFSYRTLMNDGRPNFRRVYQLISNVTTDDERTIRFDLAEGFDEETVMIIAIMPVLSKAYWSGREFDSSTLDVPVTSGPYEIANIDPGSRIVYKKRDDYWGQDLFVHSGQNNFDKIRYDYYRDKNVAFEAFQAGDLSLWREDDASRWQRALSQPNNYISKAFPHARPERVNALIFNTRRAPFDDIRVRHALNLAFNAQWINENIYANQFKRISSFYPNSELAAKGPPSEQELAILNVWKDSLLSEVFDDSYTPPLNNDRRSYRKNLRQASELLDEAGWVIKDGKRVHKENGDAFAFEIILNDKKQEKIGLTLSRSLETLGITVNLRMLDSAAFIGRLNNYDYDMVLHYWLSTLSPGTEQILFWGCKAAQQEARWNYAGICHPAIDDISKKIAFAKSREDLVTLTRVLDRILTHGQYMIPLFYEGEDWISYWPPLEHPDNTALYGVIQESWWQNSKIAEGD